MTLAHGGQQKQERQGDGTEARGKSVACQNIFRVSPILPQAGSLLRKYHKLLVDSCRYFEGLWKHTWNLVNIWMEHCRALGGACQGLNSLVRSNEYFILNR